MDYLNIAKELGKFCYSKKNIYDILDIVLFGSVAKKSTSPNDVDILIIHNNLAFEEIQKMHHHDGCSNDIQRLELLDNILKKYDYPSIMEIKNNEILINAISNNIINLRYLHKNFFYDRKYYLRELSRNIDPHFFNNLFNHALLWDPSEGDYVIPLRYKYTLLKNNLLDYLIYDLDLH